MGISPHMRCYPRRPYEIEKSRSVSHSVMSGSLRPIDCSPPGFSVHGILQARILEWVTIPFQGIFPTQGSNLCLLSLSHWQVDSLPLAPPTYK